MRVSKYIFVMILVFGIAYFPVLLLNIEPTKTIIKNFFSFNLENFYVNIMFLSEQMVLILPMVIMIIGMFIASCIYEGRKCSWSKKKEKEHEFIPTYFNDMEKN